MTQIIVVTSGKGGVGKTTTSASIAMGLAQKGHKTAVIDFDFGLRNLDLIMGCERRVVFDFVDVIEERATLEQALITDKRESNLSILAAPQTKDKDALVQSGVKKIIMNLKELNYEYIICDSPAGIEQGALMAMYFATKAIIVSNPEVSSIRDSDRIIGLLDSKTEQAKKGHKMEKHLLITRYSQERSDKEEMLTMDSMQEILRLDLIGVIAESEDVIQASNLGEPVIMKEDSNAAKGYLDTVERLRGNDVEMKIHSQVKKVSFFKKLMGVKK